MLRRRATRLRLALLLADGAAAAALFVLVSAFRLGPGWTGQWLGAGAPWWVWATAYGCLWVAAEWTQELDQLRARWTFRGEVRDIMTASLILAVAVFSMLFLVHAPDVSRLLLVILFGAQVILSTLQRRGIRSLLVVARNGGIGAQNLIVLGTGPTATSVADLLERHPALGYRIAGFLGTPVLGCPRPIASLDEVETVIHSAVVDEVVAALEGDEAAYLDPVIALCHAEGKRLRVVLQPGLAVAQGSRVETIGGLDILTISNGPDRLVGLLAKRIMDVVLAASALVLLSPLLVLIAIAIKLADGGPILFGQSRVGLNGRPFAMYKFRSMVPDAEARRASLDDLNELSGPVFKIRDDPRITRVGRFLRKSSLDELPQLVNVLLGQMSIVGPRPPLLAEVASYDLWHRRRLSMKPGITGLWQVSDRSAVHFDRWVQLDLTYIDRWSVWLDLKIMLRTIPAMLTGR